MEISIEIPQELGMNPLNDPAIPTPWYLYKITKISIQHDTCISVFIAMKFTIAKL